MERGRQDPPVRVFLRPADHPSWKFTLSDNGGHLAGIRRFASDLPSTSRAEYAALTYICKTPMLGPW